MAILGFAMLGVLVTMIALLYIIGPEDSDL